MLMGCANSAIESADGQDPNRGMKTGAAGGALLGLVMGAAAGDASLAVKGAAVGAAAGGLAGASADYANDREDYRNENGNKNININGLPSQSVNAGASSSVAANWDRLDDFSGEWQVNIWAVNSDGERIEATAQAQGNLIRTTATELSIKALNVNGVDQAIAGNVELAYTPDMGYSLQTEFNGNDKLRFTGEFQSQQQRYNYYPVGVNGQTYSGDDRSKLRLELRFAGKDVFLVDTFSVVNGQEVQIQSYRFTRQS
ncbi:hypothetical protein JMA39_06975 [Shewanella schlegeliana]|uniref:Glycine zipper domain-containing protein n=2 Tax=Shewanella schlegeliana TaxID=190308 RepID=A0ABS1SWW7_9GAMM|nr:hypothetical protein [Shewanella schlegeliana]